MLKEFFQFLKDLVKERKLILQFAKNDFRARYAGSMLGIVWAFVSPMIMAFTYWFVFTNIMPTRVAFEGAPYIVFLMSGLVPWLYFSDSLTSITGVFREYSYLVKKVVFNIRILPTVKLVSNLVPHLFFILLTIVIGLFQDTPPTIKIIQIFYYLFCMCVFLTGITWITASIQPFFPDISQFIGVFMQALMWATPVLYSPSNFSNPVVLTILKLNPMYYVVTGYRSAFLGQSWFWENPSQTLYFWGVTLVMLVLGFIIFRRLKPHFSDVL